MEKTNEILTIAGKRVRVAYCKPGEDCCARCCFSFGGGETCAGLDGGEEWPCEKFDLATAYFVEAEQPEEETHSLREWAQILATNPDLRAEFDKMCPPQPIQGSIAPEADKMRQPVLDDLDAEFERFLDDVEGAPRMYHPEEQIEWAKDIARHFAEWERKRTLDKVVEWMKANLAYTHPRKGNKACMVNIPAFRDAMNEENT